MDSQDEGPVALVPKDALYQPYTTDEDIRRINAHYEQPAEFFQLVTGGRWNVYSCNIWDEGATLTKSQEAKLDLLAGFMHLEPGQKILDVGCGWGGPLVYLSKKYGVSGMGITVAPAQKRAAERLVADERVDVQIVESHWRDFSTATSFDAVYTDEVIVHFYDLGDFFSKVRGLLKVNGLMVNKDLHFSHRKYGRDLQRATSFVNEIYGATGNYRTLAEELALVDEAGFDLRGVHQIPLLHYRKTMDAWLSNMEFHRARLQTLVGPAYFERFRKYLRIARRYIASGPMMGLHVVVSENPGQS